MAKVLIAAGGTGGHIVPAITLADELNTAGVSEVVFVGVGKELEKKLVEGAGYQLEILPFVPVLGGGVGGLIKFFFTLPGAILKGIKLFRSIKPQLVIGFGGFPSFVPIVVAWLLRIPRVLFEQNVKVGLANKILSLFADKLFAVPRASGFWSKKEVQYVGNPVRKDFYSLSPYKLPKSDEPFRLLVVGGSQGAKSLNSYILNTIPLFKKQNAIVWHQTGKLDYERVNTTYKKSEFKTEKLTPFIDNMAKAYEWAHLVVSRAGAMSVAEVMASGRPAIFVPLQIAAGHQRENIPEGEAIVAETEEELQQELTKLLLNPANLKPPSANYQEPSKLGESILTLL